jgi:hypothetical protein
MNYRFLFFFVRFLPYLQYCFCENPFGFLQSIDNLYFLDQRLFVLFIYTIAIKNKYLYFLFLYILVFVVFPFYLRCNLLDNLLNNLLYNWSWFLNWFWCWCNLCIFFTITIIDFHRKSCCCRL